MATKHWGPDVSEWQGSAIDWRKVRAQGAVFAIARTSYGSDHTDKTFAGNAFGIRNAGLHLGSYIYCLPFQDAVTQAHKFVSDLKAVGYKPAASVVEAFQGKGDLPPALDLEATAQEIGGCKNVHAWIHHMTSEIQSLLGVRPLYYTYKSWWEQYVGNCATCGQHELWFASYPAQPNPDNPPPVPAPWKKASLWQYAGTSVSINGIPGKNDCSYLMLDIPKPAQTVIAPKPAPKPPVPKPTPAPAPAVAPAPAAPAPVAPPAVPAAPTPTTPVCAPEKPAEPWYIGLLRALHLIK